MPAKITLLSTRKTAIEPDPMLSLRRGPSIAIRGALRPA